jgi:23S rRNA pseudouridine2605 synthase
MSEERVQKILARAGYGSRRSCEELILANRVRINNQLAVLGSKADPVTDTIQVDGQRIPNQPAPVYVMLHKPQGVLSDVETHGDSRKTVRDMIPIPGHLFSVGRLDYESEGLILLTNDGELANQLTHPRYGHEKEYRVLVASRPDERQLEALRHGVVLEDGYRTAPASVREESSSQGKGVWLRIVLREGKKRQIREMCKQIGLLVQRIVRVRIGGLRLGNLKIGEWRQLTPEEIKILRKK